MLLYCSTCAVHDRTLKLLRGACCVFVGTGGVCLEAHTGSKLVMYSRVHYKHAWLSCESSACFLLSVQEASLDRRWCIRKWQ